VAILPKWPANRKKYRKIDSCVIFVSFNHDFMVLDKIVLT